MVTHDGREGYERASVDRFDVIVLDRMLPTARRPRRRRADAEGWRLDACALSHQPFGIDDRVEDLRGRRRRLSRQAVRLRGTYGAHYRACPASDFGGADPAQGRRSRDGPRRAPCAGAARRSTFSRANSSCSNSSCARRPPGHPHDAARDRSGTTISIRRPTSSRRTSADCAARSIAAPRRLFRRCAAPGIRCVSGIRLLRTASFRLAVLYLVLFTASALALGAFVYVSVQHEILTDFDERVVERPML